MTNEQIPKMRVVGSGQAAKPSPAEVVPGEAGNVADAAAKPAGRSSALLGALLFVAGAAMGGAGGAWWLAG